MPNGTRWAPGRQSWIFPSPRDQPGPQQRRLAGPGRPDHRQREPGRAGPGGQPHQVQHEFLAAEEPGGVVGLEAGQAPVRCLAAGRPPARSPADPAERFQPAIRLHVAGDAAGSEDLEEELRLVDRGQVPRGEVVANGAGRDAAGPGHLPHREPGPPPGQRELPAEVLLAADPAWIGQFGTREWLICHRSPVVPRRTGRTCAVAACRWYVQAARGGPGEGRARWIGRPRGIRGSAPRASVASPGSGGRLYGLVTRRGHSPTGRTGRRTKARGPGLSRGVSGDGPPGQWLRGPPSRGFPCRLSDPVTTNLRSVAALEYDADVSSGSPGRAYSGQRRGHA